MIRIDEIYCNTFLPRVQSHAWHGMHWFDPFGSVKFEDLCNLPPLPSDPRSVRFLFWDQEPLHQDLIDHTLSKFVKIFNGQYHIIVSEYASENSAYIQHTYGFKPHYYFFHGWAALDWYRGYNRTFLSIPYQHRKIEHLFLCPNNVIGGRRHHRLALLSELVQNNLVNNNLISFPATCPYEHLSVDELCKIYNIPPVDIDLPLIIDQGKNFHAQSHSIDLWPWANKSLLQIITETVYHGQRQHLTEKTFKPIAMCQPFIMVSCQGSLEYLRRYGFKTFGDFWDESYDYANDDQRIKQITKVLKDLNNLSKKELQQLHNAMQPIVEHNYNHFYSGTFENQYLWPELSTMLEGMNV